MAAVTDVVHRLVILVLLITGCQTETRLFPHGPAAGDDSLQCGGQKSCSTGFLSTAPVYIFKKMFNKINIYSNGYITMNTPYDGRQPKRGFRSMFTKTKMAAARAKGFAIIAPLWTDNDARYGSVYYHVYDSALETQSATVRTVFERATNATKQYTSTDGDAVWVLVVTWSAMLPRMWYSPILDKPNIFQLILIQDPVKWRTSAMFIYEETGWDNTLSVRGNIAGYYVVGQQDENVYAGPLSFKALGLDLASVTGNRLKTGESFFKLSELRHDPNYDHMCHVWYGSETASFTATLPCPCNVAMAKADARWRPDGVTYTDDKTCFYERMPAKTSAQSCCYSSVGYLLTREDGSAGPTFLHHTRDNNHRKTDWEPHYWCCVKSHNCDKFYALRPVDSCDSYTAPSIAWMLGDPHIQTLDGFRYTFNGLGEYTLLTTKDNTFMLQARTRKARAMDGSDVNAAVVSAVAARGQDADTIHVELNETATGLIIVVGYDFHTTWHTESSVGDEKLFDGFALSKEGDTSLITAFTNGIVLTVTATEGRLDLSVLVPVILQGPLTRGMFGVFDGDPTNDLTPVRKDGTNGIPLSTSGSSERSIYNNFAESWRTPKIDRLFYYYSGTSVITYDNPNFRPLFSDEFLGDHLSSLTSDERAKYASTCHQNTECKFDLALTKDIQFAASTYAEIRRHGVTKDILANGSPKVKIPRELNATVGKSIEFTVQTTEASEDDTVTIRNVSTLPPESLFNLFTGLFTWTPRDRNVVAIRFVGEDQRNSLSAEAHVVINLCSCSEHGTCLFNQLAYGEYYSSTFRVVACQCDIGWTGESCDVDFDGCAYKPCMVGTTCTDALPVAHAQSGKAFTCSECPAGYEQNYGICVDVNECQRDSTNTCHQRCVNVPMSASPGSSRGFSCGCVAGYILEPDSTTCKDIDECDGDTSGCSQGCTNLAGSSVCWCHPGYALEEDNHTCSKTDVNHCDSVTCQNGGTCQDFVNDYTCVCAADFTGTNCETKASPCRSNPCIHGAICQDDSKNYVCQCPRGYFGSRCEYEVDECLIYPCSNGGSCKDRPGRYSCTCPEAYTGENCLLPSNLCSSDPCFNGATCHQTAGRSFSCVCHRGYSGTNCEHGVVIPRTIKFRILNMAFTLDLGNKNTIAYHVLADDLGKRIEDIYAKSTDVGAHLIGIEDIVFSSGSVVVMCTLSLNEDMSPAVLNDILDRAINDRKFQSYYDISTNSEEVSRKNTTEGSLSLRVQIIIGCAAAVVVSVEMILVYLSMLRLTRSKASEDKVDMVAPVGATDGDVYEELAPRPGTT